MSPRERLVARTLLELESHWSTENAPESLESLVGKHKDLFKDELGTLKHFKATLQVWPDQILRALCH